MDLNAEREIRVEVDPDLCVGTGECERLLSEVFTLNRSDGVARAVSPVAGELIAELMYAIDSCPTGAIRMH